MKIYKKTTIDYNALPFLVLWTLNIILPNFVYANKNVISISDKSSINSKNLKSSNSNKKPTILPNPIQQSRDKIKKSNINKAINPESFDSLQSINNTISEYSQKQFQKIEHKRNSDENIYNSTVLYDNENDDSGPSSPEFSSFESVSTDKMVDPFTGDFTYNLPLLEVPGAHDGGYPITLSYHSGASPDAEASWVGYGFTLSPGAINRNKRGFPDDLKAGEIEYINEVPPNITVSVSPSAAGEAFSLDLSISKTLTYNNYKGIRTKTGLGLGNKYGGVNFTYDNGKHSFSPYINYVKILNDIFKKQKKEEIKKPQFQVASFKGAKLRFSKKGSLNLIKSSFLNSRFYTSHNIGNDLSSPSSVSSFKGTSYTYEMGSNTDPAFVIAGFKGKFSCNFTRVKNTKNIKNAYGYIYSNLAYTENPENFIMDYHTEKEASATYRDNYIPVTISDNDMFTVSTEGISGSFRAYWQKGGLYLPPTTVSNIAHVNVALPEFHLGTDVGMGLDLSGGNSENKMGGDWEKDYGANNNNNTDNLKFEKSSSEDVFFRFNGDLTGDINIDNNLTPVKVNLESNGSGGTQPNSSNVSTNITSNNFLNSKRVGKSSQIRFFTNKQINNRNIIESPSTTSTIPKLLYDIKATESFIKRDDPKIEDHIGEFVITNTEGSTYVYALPVYNKDEKSMQFNVPYANRKTVNGSQPGDYHIYADINNELPHTGESQKYAYANSFLLTSIRSSNYQDIDNNGIVNENDLGGYTNFEYENLYGNFNKSSNTEWFHWRLPHSGLFLEQGQLNNRSDDMGSFTSGQKEVYNLKKIETKTHVAFFITNKTQANGVVPAGSQSTRFDGRSPNSDDFLAAKQSGNGNQESRFLEKIILYAKYKEGGVPKLKKIKTVNFKYTQNDSYPWNGVWPNSMGSEANKGKLTLSKVWVDDEEIVNAKVTPYEFKYEYPSNSNYPTKYQNIKDFYNKFSGSISGNNPEKPDYLENSAINADRWGNYQAEGQQRKAILNPYVDQTPLPNFDPAAWELKQIKLPTGAEIHVQYEQDDYAFVQDRIATSMVTIQDDNTIPGPDEANKYFLNIENIPSSNLTEYKNFLKNYFLKNPYVYFKFLYGIKDLPQGASGLPLSSTDCKYEYIDGYVKIDPANIDILNNKLFVRLGDGNPTNPPSFNLLNSTGTSLPRYLCYDYYITETGKQAGNCTADGLKEEVLGSMDGISIAKDVMQYCTASLESTFGVSFCVKIIANQSYLRMPIMPNSLSAGKLGGGLRVKRVLMYDEGIESNNSDLALYGTEYIYKLDDNITSSGVASNEPLDGKEENPIIDFIKKKDDKTFLNKVLGGLDKEQFEGPYGESFLPSASVGYSRVITKSIHEGKTDIGFTVNEFYTAKDYSFDKSFFVNGQEIKAFESTAIDKEKSFPLNIPTGIVNITNNKMWMSQGYRFLSFDRHGLPKSIESYQGVDINNFNSFNKATNPPLYKKTFTYFEPWEEIPVVKDVISDIPILKPIGREMEIYTERRYIGDVTNIGGATLDASVGLVIPPPIISVSGMPTYTRSVDRFSRISTTKVVYLPNILKSTTEIKEGITTTNENVAFSEFTGNPVVTKVNDIFYKLPQSQIREIWNYNQQAALDYSSFKSKSINEFKVWPTPTSNSTSGTVYYNQSLQLNYLEFSLSTTPTIEEMNLSVGDLLLFENASQDYENSTSNKYLYVSGVNYFQSANDNKVRYFLESYNPTANFGQFSFNKFTVVKSGRPNELSTSSGNITTLNSVNYLQTTVAPSIINERNSFLSNLNASSNFINGNGTYSLNNNTANNKIMAGTNVCLSGITRTYGCSAPPPVECIKKECCLTLGTASDDVNPNTNTQEFYIFLADKNHTLNIPINFPPAPPLPPLPSNLTSNLTDVLDYCCNPPNGSCIGCPLIASNSNLPFYINSFPITIDPSIPITNPVGQRFVVKPDINSLVNSFGIYYEPDNSTSILIPFLKSLNSSLLVPIADELENRFDQTFNTQNIHFNFSEVMRCLPTEKGFGDDFNNDNDFDSKTESFSCNDCYNYIPPTSCPCTTLQSSNFYLKTFTNPTTNEMYVTVLDQFHNSSQQAITNYPILDNYLSSIASSNFTNNKSEVCQNQFCASCPPAPIGQLPYIINYQKVGKAGGTFKLDPYNKYTVLYTPPNDEPITVNILDFCTNAVASGTITNVLANSAVIYKHKWIENSAPKYYDIILANSNSINNSFLKNKKGFWNPSKSFIYKEDRTNANPNSINKVYDKGTYAMSYGGWINPDISSKWITTSTIKSISPNGEPLEEVDAIGNANTSSLEGDMILPNYVAKNASLNSVMFESIESPNFSINGNAVSVSSFGHSGEKSIKLDISTWGYYQKTIPYSPDLLNKEVIVRFWASADPNYKEANSNLTNYKYFEQIKGEFHLTSSPTNTIPFIAKKIATSGVWNLYEATVQMSLPNSTQLNFQIWNEVKLNNSNSFTRTDIVYVDDIRIQPKVALVKSYVYDYLTRRIIAEFDDQNFGLYYLYNSEGKLVRKIKETERGLKMLEEKQYNLKNKITR